MKKILLTAAAAVLFISASFAQTKVISSKKTVTPRKTVTKTTTVVTPKGPSAAELAEGKELLKKSDCLTCHKEEQKVVGPAYKDVAKKYTANESTYEMLVKKVIAGGSGNWGAVAMAPHASLPEADAKKMVEYILSLK